MFSIFVNNKRYFGTVRCTYLTFFDTSSAIESSESLNIEQQNCDSRGR